MADRLWSAQDLRPLLRRRANCAGTLQLKFRAGRCMAGAEIRVSYANTQDLPLALSLACRLGPSKVGSTRRWPLDQLRATSLQCC